MGASGQPRKASRTSVPSTSPRRSTFR
ncbi:hypothetical protein GQ600_9983 [Phytophthora cactorum]|nr:hypothetical protein GQ600_9983 [Phytophthora cactorum]